MYYTMKKIDLKDRKILYALDVDARQSFAKIGKVAGATKSSVAYRIQRLEEEGIIKNYYTFIDGIRLGYIVLRLYIIYQYTTNDLEKEIIAYFKAHKNVVALYSLHGRYDLEVIFFIKNINSFYSFWQQTFYRYGDYFQDQILSFYIKYITYKCSYLQGDKRNPDHAKHTDIMGGQEPIALDPTDNKILSALASRARTPLTEIAELLGMSSDTINYHIRKLIQARVIRSFRANIDYAKIGYHFFKADIYLKDYSARNKIINYITLDPHLISINETTGSSHLELEFHLPSLSHLHNLMNEINTTFPNAMRNYKYFNFQKVHKYVFLPDQK
jgi:DNA-binding Lrp family transcriptional regulator